MNKVIAEIIDNEFNKNILVYESHNDFYEALSNRGLKVFKVSPSTSFPIEEDIDSALININLSLIEDINPILKISENLTYLNGLKKIYILIRFIDSNDIFVNMRSVIKAKLLQKRIKNILSSKRLFSEFEINNIFKHNNKIQQILPKNLIIFFYRRQWKMSSGSFFYNILKWLKFILVKFSLLPISNELLIVFEYEK